jgi:diguanylate cyclase (GGDEF)-like protein
MNKRIRTQVINAHDYTILAVDDAQDTLVLLDFDLSGEGFTVLTAKSGRIALSMMQTHPVDLVLLDIYMPGISGLSTLKEIKSKPEFSHIPVIMLSASGDEDQIVTALECGAADYATKPYNAKILLARIRTSLRLMKKNIELESIARTDYLTKLDNRGSFDELTQKAISQAKRNQQTIVLAMFDIDYFKRVNDDFGHQAGDQSLMDFAEILRENFRDYDILGRIGGEEFAVTMLNTGLTEAYDACERFRQRVEHHQVTVESNGKLKQISFTVSIGLTNASDSQMTYKALIESADQALYQAKQTGRNNTFSTNTLEKDDVSKVNACIDFNAGVANVLGDETLFKQILQMFYQDHGNDHLTIEQAIKANNHDDLKECVHRLKGVASSIGAMQLFECTQRLDNAIDQQRTDRYCALLSPLALQLVAVLDEIAESYN